MSLKKKIFLGFLSFWFLVLAICGSPIPLIVLIILACPSLKLKESLKSIKFTFDDRKDIKNASTDDIISDPAFRSLSCNIHHRGKDFWDR